MRLTCPNCDAQYEVDDDVIPPAGRDVQCSNCGHAWFEPGRNAAAADADAGGASGGTPEATPDGMTPESADAAAQETVAEPPAPEEAVVEPEPAAASEPPEPAEAEVNLAGPEESDDSDEPPAPPPPEHEAERRTLDDAVVNVLREEAERESRARRAEGLVPLETQPELGLAESAAAVAGVVAAARAAEMRGAGDQAAAAEPADDAGPAEDQGPRSPRRALLPDIEEINSTLSASSARTDDSELPPTAETIAQRKSGFRRGFSIALFIMILLLATYVLAPNIVARVPATEPVLRAYVEQIDRLRLRMDEWIRSSTEALRGDEDEATQSN